MTQQPLTPRMQRPQRVRLRPRHRPRRQSLAQVFAIPLALLLASLAGLVIGLTGDGWPDLVSSALLLLPLLALASVWHRRG